MTGYFGGVDDTLFSEELSSSGGADVLLLKFDPNGNILPFRKEAFIYRA